MGYKKNLCYLLVLIILLGIVLAGNILYKNNELTQEAYEEHRERIKLINTYIMGSPNIRFMEYRVDKLIDEINKDIFIKENIERCININYELERLFKEQDSTTKLYYYFKDKENRKKILEL